MSNKCSSNLACIGFTGEVGQSSAYVMSSLAVLYKNVLRGWKCTRMLGRALLYPSPALWEWTGFAAVNPPTTRFHGKIRKILKIHVCWTHYFGELWYKISEVVKPKTNTALLFNYLWDDNVLAPVFFPSMFAGSCQAPCPTHKADVRQQSTCQWTSLIF